MKKMLLFIILAASLAALDAQVAEYRLPYLKGYGPDSVGPGGLTEGTWSQIPNWTDISNPALRDDGSLVVPEASDLKGKFKLAYNELALFGIIDIEDDVIIPLLEGENGDMGEVDFATIQIGASENYWPCNTYLGYGVDPSVLHDLSSSFWWSTGDQECITHSISPTHYQLEFSFRWSIQWTKVPDAPIFFPNDTMNLEIVLGDSDEEFAGMQSQLQWGDATGIPTGAWHEGNYIAENWGRFIIASAAIATAADTILYSTASGIRDHQMKSLSVYPNPASDQLRFTENVEAYLYSLQGELLKTIINKNTMDISDLPKGMYMIRTSRNEVAKVVKK